MQISGSGSTERLYREVARILTDRIASGIYPVGGKLPAEREISAEFNISRPTAREAIIAMEAQGLVEVKIGSGTYVLPSAPSNDPPGFDVSAFELTEARLLIEGESAALAAVHIVEEELDELTALVREIERVGPNTAKAEDVDRDFHILIARATRNAALLNSVRSLWEIRRTSPECALLHEKARSADVRPAVEEHLAIVSALRTRDPATARAAMRTHLAAVIDHLLFATEEDAIQRIKDEVRTTRARLTRAISA